MFKSDACAARVELCVGVNEDEERKQKTECMFHLDRAKEIERALVKGNMR
jgi:hypothetical protein